MGNSEPGSSFFFFFCQNPLCHHSCCGNAIVSLNLMRRLCFYSSTIAGLNVAFEKGNDRPASDGEGRGSATLVVSRFLIRNEAKIFSPFAVG